jgi:tetratricopeptide (TPR) repeat protein
VAALAVIAGPQALHAACEPWPDEPRPLPTLSDPDALRERWARLRLREISEVARSLAADDPVRARALWEHALCIAPGDPEAAQGAGRKLGAVAVHRPPVLKAPEARPAEEAWSSLETPIEIVANAAPRPSGPERVANAEVDKLLAETAAHVREARFEDALQSAEQARSSAANLRGRAKSTRSARLELYAATAEIALGRDEEARTSLRRALDADPALRLDAATTSPKVRRALEDVRAERTR